MDSISKDHGISIKWEEISIQQDDELDWVKITPM